MKITVKTLHQQTFPIEIEPSQTVLSVKRMIHSLQGIEPELQKLIFMGKILQDNSVVEEYKMKDNDFLVLMTTKPKKAPAPAPAPVSPASIPSRPAATTTQAPAPAPAPASAAPSAPLAAQPAATTAAQAPAANAPSSDSNDGNTLLTGQAFEDTVTRLVELGFDRTQVLAALRASFNNPDRAVEYLMTGIPQNLQQNEADADEAQPAPSSPNAAPVRSQADSANIRRLIATIQSHPQLRTLKDAVYSNPQLLPQFLELLGRSNPEILAVIEGNQEEFLYYMNEPPAGPPAGNVIQVTPEEKESIDRLESLGFSRHLAIQAFFAFDKDETAAANYLFDTANEDQ
eukprot:TRINITY_DN6265_c0_g1_i1.p1 TRINITY_DN6265_c0_g1~~TRINITY_DN6265_c0_g1_i1.p1  ORF type:complete len:351 (+),score=140.33 TRINITY_DN6265_c0_g1_i1:24-1055(+)